MIKKILVAYDGSEPAARTFDFALDLARRYSAELHILAVARPPEFGTEVETEAVIESSRRHYGHVLQPLKTRLATESIQAKFEVTIGHPAEQILRYAERHGIDHIVVGHRGHSVFKHWLLGSVARQVIAHAPCAVTVVRK
jgi:nucleotide-binding universal stress UspA family protein